MLNLQNLNITAVPSYATTKNARFNNSANDIVTLKQRWEDSFDILTQSQKSVVWHTLNQITTDFKLRHPNVKNWEDIDLAESLTVPLSEIYIDKTMQRELVMYWVLTLLSDFNEVKVVPIQVYRGENNELIAWDGMHTAIMLWLLCTQVLCLDPKNVRVPVNIYKSSKKSAMRDNFISLNGSAKKPLDQIDIWEQMIFGVRIDLSNNETWKIANDKQLILEKYDLFVTSKKFGDEDQYSAISRLQEINKLPVDCVEWLAYYLCLVSKNSRPIIEKEIVMMAHYFDRCRRDNIKVTNHYIEELAKVNLRLFDADFSPTGKFWAKARSAYINWHQAQPYINPDISPRFKSEPVHGFPFLVAQLQKDFGYKVPSSDSNSEFRPNFEDLF